MSIVVFKLKNDDFVNGNAIIGTQTCLGERSI